MYGAYAQNIYSKLAIKPENASIIMIVIQNPLMISGLVIRRYIRFFGVLA